MYHVIIIGAGAAGTMCAIEAGKRGRRVLLLEHNRTIGEKIRISGGGRCNFTNVITRNDHYLSENPDFCRSALARFTPDDFLALVERHCIRYHEKKSGQLFCDESSRQILEMLHRECREAGVEIRSEVRVRNVRKAETFVVTTGTEEIAAQSVVVATGGLSIPKLGATDTGYDIARSFGLRVVPQRPGLVPIRFNREDTQWFGSLSGISIDVIASCGGHSFREDMLFTHRGLSGPAILQVSSYWEPGKRIEINLSPGRDLREWFRSIHASKTEFVTLLADILPKRLARTWCERFAPSMPMRNYSPAELDHHAEQLHAWHVAPAGTEGYEKAEVTCGGVDTRDLSSKTMEAANVPGLFFVGEVVDVTGHLGGYNFQWAWASGYAAGQHV
jgi:hypothetical protein